jgi:hypothetical protein
MKKDKATSGYGANSATSGEGANSKISELEHKVRCLEADIAVLCRLYRQNSTNRERESE